MPTYEYECTACRHRFEKRQSIHAEHTRVCPKCGKATRKVIHPVGIVFKGSGFYVTDNRPTSPGRKATSETDEKPAAETKPSDDKKETTASAKESGDGESPATEKKQPSPVSE